ncbi:MAG TPA: ABC transporter permease subunit [Acidimicrobiales bacterium]|jgi:molybdate transport system permease protein|nr:ABC transporter permease subunit [Acidimicrobiales bacterium]
MNRSRELAQTLDGPQRTVVVVAVALAGLALGYGAAHFFSGSIAYWGVVSGPFFITLRVVIPATLIAGSTGIGAGYLLAKGRFPGRDLLETIGSLPIILPPTVIGFYLLEVLSPGSAIGGFVTRAVGHVLVYNVFGCIIAASVAAFPFCMRSARAAIEGVDPTLEQAGRTIGLSNWRVALQVTLPLARRGIATGLTIGCARALGEYGATLMVGGDINGKTRTLSLAVLDSFTTPERNAMLLILVLLAIAAMTGVGLLGRSRS